MDERHDAPSSRSPEEAPEPAPPAHVVSAPPAADLEPAPEAEAASPDASAPRREDGDSSPDSGQPAEPAREEISPGGKKAAPPPPPPRRRRLAERLDEIESEPVAVPRRRLRRQTRRDFVLFGAGAALAAAGVWWLLPDETKQRAPFPHDWLDTLEARLGASPARRERLLDRALTLDDDIAEALYSPDRRVRTYRESDVTPLRNNYTGRTPDPAYIPGWRLTVEGLASGHRETFSIGDLLARFPRHDQVTRLCCVEGWSAIAAWGGLRFADLLRAFPPAAGARWIQLHCDVNLDWTGNPDPYYVSIDMPTARHPQTLLATRWNGRPLPVEHGAPLRLVAPMKLGLKNIKAITRIAYTADEPPDYWNERGYSKYDGL